MADLTIVAASVKPTSTTEPVETGTAGGTIAAGEVVYKHSDGTYKLAQADVALGAADAGVVGMAMNSAATGQSVVVSKGLITIGSGFTAGTQVNLSAAAGKVCPVADTLAATNVNVVTIGCIMTNGNDLLIGIRNWSVIKA